MGSLHSLETTLHSLQQTYLRPSIHTTQNFKWSRYTLTTLNISQLQTFIYLIETAHPHTTKQLTRTYNTAYSTSQTSHTQSGDVNAHSTLWHSYTDDHRGQLIADVISNPDHISLITNIPTECQTPHYSKHHHQISPRCLPHCTTGHRGQLNTHYHQTTFP